MSHLDHHQPDEPAQGGISDTTGCGLICLLSVLLIGITAVVIFIASW